MPETTVNVSSFGYNGALKEADTGPWLAYGSALVPTFVGSGWAPSVGSGDRVVSLAPGWAGGDGVVDLLNAASPVALSALTSAGSRWDTLYIKRNKTPDPGGTTSVWVAEGTVGATTKVDPPAPTAKITYAPIAMVQITGPQGAGSIAGVIDLRAGRLEAVSVPHVNALDPNWPDGVVVTLPTGAVFARQGGQWVNPLKASGWGRVQASYSVPGTVFTGWANQPITNTTKTLHPAATVPVPQGVRALVTIRSWVVLRIGAGSVGALTCNGDPGAMEIDLDSVGNTGTGWLQKRLVSEDRFEVVGPMSFQPQIYASGSLTLWANPAARRYAGSTWKWESL